MGYSSAFMGTLERKRKRILVTIPSTHASCREIIKGLGGFCRRKDDWEVTLMQAERFSVGDLRQAIEKEPRIDGVIDNESHLPELVEAFAGTDIPIIVIGSPKSGSYPDARNLVFVELDNHAVGAFAARYLAELGNFASYAFIAAQTEATWSIIRHDGYVDFFRKRGTPVFEHQSGQGATALEAFIANLPKPTAIMCAWDYLALEAVNACRQAGVYVPRQATVVGVDNDETICEFVSPAISSVALPHEELSRRAVDILDGVLKGSRPSVKRILVNTPPRVFERESSAPTAPATDLIRKALLLVRENAARKISVSAIAENLGVSRQLLELRFREIRGETLRDVIIATRLDEVKRRLRETKHALGEIALACGYDNPSYLRTLFRKRVGMTMSEYRRGRGA